jgi:hypothetical protein
MPVAFLVVSIPNPTIDRTFQAVYELPPERQRAKHQPQKCYRNPVMVAQAWPPRLHRDNATPADLVRQLGVSRARVTQISGNDFKRGFTAAKERNTPPRRAPRLWAHADVGFIEHEYLSVLAKAGRGKRRWNGDQLGMA